MHRNDRNSTSTDSLDSLESPGSQSSRRRGSGNPYTGPKELVSRTELLESVDLLSAHLPQTVLDQLVKQVVNEENEDQVLRLLGKSIPVTQNSRNSRSNGSSKKKSRDKQQRAEKQKPIRRCKSTSMLADEEQSDSQQSLKQALKRLSCPAIDTSSMDESCSTNSDFDSVGADLDRGVAKLCQGRLSSSNSFSSTNECLSVATASSADHSVVQHHAHHAAKCRLESTRHNSALLFVDISGFTKLSQMLEVESLSKVINSYFQKIVDIIQAHDGDVLKFAGDALLVEWKENLSSNNSSSNRKDLHPAHRAVVCGSMLVNACSDWAPQTDALLNIHCAIGYGSLVGTHVGNRNRMEYLVLGDALRQIAQAVPTAKLGEVVASPETIQALDGTLIFSSSLFCQENQQPQPQVVAYKSQLLFRPIHDNIEAAATNTAPSENTTTKSKFTSRCKGWTTSMLMRLKNRMSLYAHPAILQNHQTPLSASSQLDGSLNRCNSRRPSRARSLTTTIEQAELRDVVTIFIQPILPDSIDLMDPSRVSNETLELLQQIMMIVQSEAEHYQGQLRQFIVDDKGLVVIVNFGLRGSTFPNMVEERTMPCIRNIQTLLRTELSIDSRVGATSGKAYCGVVGGHTRHEYAVMGPTVNLAARLMGNKENPGVLVDQTLQRKAGSNHPFHARTPIKAKGFDSPVRIYEPTRSQKVWKIIGTDQFVGRFSEISHIKSLARDILKNKSSSSVKRKSLTSPSSKFVFIEGAYGYGKSCLLSLATHQIEALSLRRPCFQYHVTRHVFNEDDSFKPFSIVQPLFMDILRRKKNQTSSSKTGASPPEDQKSSQEFRKQEEAHLYLIFLQTCLQAGIPMQYIEMFAGMIFTESLAGSDIGKWSDKEQKMSQWNKIAYLLVKVYLEMTSPMDLVLLALDDISCMDEMSWKIVQRLHVGTCSSKFLILGAARNEFGLNIQKSAWEDMKRGSSANRCFSHLKLGPMEQEEIHSLTNKCLPDDSSETKAIARTIYFLSEGNPLLACEIMGVFSAKEDKTVASSSSTPEGVQELLLNRLDSLPPSVCLHLHCGAILGQSFSLSDIVAVMQKYNGITVAEEKAEHELAVRDSLEQAEQAGFVSVSQLGEAGFVSVSQLGDTGIILYTFSHALWREVISHQILQEFKDKIHQLVDSMIKSSDHITYAEFWKTFFNKQSNKHARRVV